MGKVLEETGRFIGYNLQGDQWPPPSAENEKWSDRTRSIAVEDQIGNFFDEHDLLSYERKLQ